MVRWPLKVVKVLLSKGTTLSLLLPGARALVRQGPGVCTGKGLILLCPPPCTPHPRHLSCLARPVQAPALSRGRPGQGHREHLHRPQQLPRPPAQAHTEVSRPRVGGKGEVAAFGS